MGNLLPDEILIEIFSRLPSKSVGKCRCLSKPWRCRLSTSDFINLHLSRKTHHQNLILITQDHTLRTIISPFTNGALSTPLQLTNTWTQVVASSNGLVLLENEEDELFLVNPITKQQANIPDSDLALKKNESFRMHGFGYDTLTENYKIVTLSYYDTDNEYEPDCIDTFVDVYSVKTGVWKRCNSSPYDHAVPEISSGAYVNGAIHWLASSRESGYPSVIAAFDLASEAFHEIPAPRALDVSKFVFNGLFVLGEYLCMVDRFSGSTVDMWMMKEYNVVESWTKFSMQGAKDDWDIKPVCFIGEEEFMLVVDYDGLVVFDLKEGTSKEMVVKMSTDEILASFVDAGTFVDSLVCVNMSPDVF